MNAQLRFEEMELLQAELGEEACVPDLLGEQIIQNDLQFRLDEEDEVYEGYGRCQNAYPYRRLNCYSRQLKQGVVKTAVLENDFLKAVFLPEFGGRLWSLWDKEKDRNLLYTNDVLRFSNLATRNAWFSGGVEWNLGIIGHTPFTASPLFTGSLEDEHGMPVLRMYEYERIRQVTWQMDFWLEGRFLNARMRIVNFGEAVVPMYWWSNIAVAEHENGRIIVPAEKAYTFGEGVVYKVDVPMVNGVDITKYQNIEKSVDYFFEISKNEPKYIANVDAEGYGLLHLSTDRLQARKLFSWGHTPGGDHWQEFLTQNAGKYIEIQAGIGKTQYGCVPMAPHTAWEWLERYGAIQLKEEDLGDSFETLKEKVTGFVRKNNLCGEMDAALAATKEMAKREAHIWQPGSGYGALKNKIRKAVGKTPVSCHLDFGECTEELKLWERFVETGELAEPDVASIPSAFVSDDFIYKQLRAGIADRYKDNWYAHYQLGIFYFQKGEYGWAREEFQQSLALADNAWARHGVAAVCTINGEKEEAARSILHGMEMQKGSLSYQKEGFHILHINGMSDAVVKEYERLTPAFKEDKRILLYYVQAQAAQGEYQKAYDLLCADGGLVVPDLREGDAVFGELWMELHEKLYGVPGDIPAVFDYKAIDL